jgi:NAD(P)-dependent dehydrogenase (short-subunit alcohol dehydrogenase family)
VTDAGGEAIAAVGDLVDENVAVRVFESALQAYGRLDAVVNNAGAAVHPHPFSAASEDDLAEMLNSHIWGPWRMTQAVWPHFLENGYGRVVFTSSLAVFGLKSQSAYATAKSSLIGLARSLSLEGVSHGIRVNTVIPTAQTRLSTPRNQANAAFYDWASTNMTTDHVAPLVAVLLHEDCPVTGELISAAAGYFQLSPLGLTAGLALDGKALTPELLLARFQEVVDPARFKQIDSAIAATSHLPFPRS